MTKDDIQEYLQKLVEMVPDDKMSDAVSVIQDINSKFENDTAGPIPDGYVKRTDIINALFSGKPIPEEAAKKLEEDSKNPEKLDDTSEADVPQYTEEDMEDIVSVDLKDDKED